LIPERKDASMLAVRLRYTGRS